MAESTAKSAADAARDVGQQGAQATRQNAQAAAETIRRAGDGAADATKYGMTSGADMAQRGAETAGNVTRRSAEALADTNREFFQQAAERFQDVSQKMAEAVQGTTEDMRAFMTLPNAAHGGLQDLQQSVSGLVEGVVRTNLRAARELFQLANPGAFVELQQRFAREYLDALMEGTATVVRATRRTADETLRPLEEKIEQRRQHQHHGSHDHQHRGFAAE